MTDGAWQIGAALLAPLVDPESRTFLPCLAAAALVAGLWCGWRQAPRALGIVHWRHRSARLDVELLAARRLLAVLSAGPKLGAAWLVGTTIAAALDRSLGVPAVPEIPIAVLSVGYSLALFVAWDLSRYVVHRLLHEVPLLWEFHQVHHSAEVLTPFTFHRVHPVEGLVYAVRGALVTGGLAGIAFWLFRGAAVEATVLGVSALGFLLNAATGNLRHSHVWMPFPAAVERWLLSPAQHQLHHAVDGDRRNYGTWLACWDRLAGSLVLSPSEPPAAYGLAERNHRDDLGSVLVGPFVGAARVLWLLLPWTARAEEEPDDEASEEIVVVAPDGAPRVAGSAHVVDEAELERFSYDDVQKVLKKVPGVYVRGEDGFGLRPNIGMRGGNSDRSAKITLLEDGVPLSPAPYAAPAAYYFPLSTRLVGIEVFKGPAAIKHGPQTVAGAVNVLTRPVPERPDGVLDLAGGMYGTARVHGWAGTGNERLGVLLEGAHLSSGGFKELDTGGPTGFARQDVLLKLRAASPGELRQSVELKVGYGRESSDETYLGLALADFEATPYRRYAASAVDHMRWDHTQESLRWDADLGRIELRTVAYHAFLGRAWTKFNSFAGGPDVHDLLLAPEGGQGEVFVGVLRGELDTGSADQELRIGTNDRTFHNGGVQVRARHHAGTEAVGNDLEIGVRLHRDEVARLHTEDPYAMTGGRPLPTGGDTAVTLDSRTRAEALAAYVHEDLRVRAVHVLPGARIELVRTSAGTSATGPVDPVEEVAVLPGIGLFGSARPWLDLFGGVHRGFSPVAPGSPPEIEPETAWSWEAGTRLHAGESHAEAVGFLSDYDNLVGQCTLSGGCTDDAIDRQYNGGEASVYGLEALISHRVGLPGRFGVGGSVSYTLTRSAFRTGFVSEFPQFGAVEAGDALPYVPEHQGAATLAADHPRGELALSVSARSAMRDVAGQGPIPKIERVPAACTLDLATTWRATRSLAAYLTVTNLTDAVVLESFRPFGARPGAPATVMAGLKLQPADDARGH